MKRILRTGVLLLMLFIVAGAVAQDRYAVRVYGEYNYNRTWQHYGDLAVQGIMPINEHFLMKASAEASTANLYSVALSMQPRFPIKVGEFFISTDVWYRAISRNRMHDFSTGISVGYRMDYVGVQVGWHARSLMDMDSEWHALDQVVTEPSNLLYSLQIWVRPQTCNWNLGLRFTNFDDFQVERIWQPMFMLNLKYSPREHIELLADVEVKETGMFHLDASFYGISARIGVGYKF